MTRVADRDEKHVDQNTERPGNIEWIDTWLCRLFFVLRRTRACTVTGECECHFHAFLRLHPTGELYPASMG